MAYWRPVRWSVVALLVVLPLGNALGADSPAEQFGRAVVPILTRHCDACHGTKAQEGGFRLDKIKDGPTALARRGVWKRVRTRVKGGEMPPPDDEDARPLSDADRQALLGWIDQALATGAEPSRRDPGPSVLRRLTRGEYLRTVRDLLSLPFGVLDRLDLPEDPPGDHFENLAPALSLAPTTLDRYFDAADRVVDQVFTRDWYGGGARNRLMAVKPNPKLPERQAAAESLSRLVRRAYRRPAEQGDVERLLGFFDRAKAKGATFEEAMRATLKPVLVSPRFLFRIEQDRPATPGWVSAPVDDHELAVRLSYFLWGTMPDDALFQQADSGKLTTDPAVLDAEVKRMLRDEKARTLTEVFAAQWIQLGKLRTARPTQEFFPGFHGGVKQAMAGEAAAFFENLRTEDRSVLDLLDCDYAFVNAELAKHYGIAGVQGDKFQKVPLEGPSRQRGGLLGMGAVLASTSHTFRTSPTLRGKYVLEVLLGTPPPPPPANAGILKDDAPAKRGQKEVTSFRELMARHATQAACAGCHAKIDPIGFALENYDAVGAWREAKPGQPLDVAGTLPSGQTMEGIAGLKKVLLDRRDAFVENLASRMLEYALGRLPGDEDEPTIQEIRESAAADGYPYSKIVLGVIHSVPFRNRRPGEAVAGNEGVR